MREAYLTGGNEHFDATDTELETACKNDVTYLFESVAITEEANLKIVGSRYTFDCTDEFTVVRNQKPHPDLLKCLRRLTLHMCLLAERLTEQQLYPGIFGLPTDATTARLQLAEAIETGAAYLHPELENFRCLAVAWKSKGIVLSGEKKSRYRCFGKAQKVETPVTKVHWGLDDDMELEEGDYPFFEQMHNALGDLQAEIIAYLGGKYGAGGEQLSLFGRDPEPRPLSAIADELLEALDNQAVKGDVSHD
jgi:hypothetical protein